VSRADAKPLLVTKGLRAFYGDFQALFDVDVTVNVGETIALIGANGAGKSTFLRTITGLLRAEPQSVLLDGEPIGGRSPAEIVRLGVAMTPEGRRMFPSLTVEENLAIGAWIKPRRAKAAIERAYALFPTLKARRDALGAALSGGEQQMVAIARALASEPRLLLFDEISLGLAPIAIGQLYSALPAIKSSGASLIVVEQDVSRALAVADWAYCFQEGRVALSGPANELTKEQIHEAYFGH
jgi:branched-chain amino acid transport system ATP-binding protein